MSNAERALEDAKAQAEHYEAACQAATKEIGEVKQRARALLEEKDAQLQVARVSFLFPDCFAGPVSAPKLSN